MVLEMWPGPVVIRGRCGRGGLRQAATRLCTGTREKGGAGEME